MSESSLNVSKPNEYQVGGEHYKTKFEHWDYVALNNMDYFAAQITRYVVRWDKKEGVKDLEKALHYVRKLSELLAAGILKYPPSREIVQLEDFAIANKLTPLQFQIFQIASQYHYREDVDLLFSLVNNLLQEAKSLQKQALEKVRMELSE